MQQQQLRQRVVATMRVRCCRRCLLRGSGPNAVELLLLLLFACCCCVLLLALVRHGRRFLFLRSACCWRLLRLHPVQRFGDRCVGVRSCAGRRGRRRGARRRRGSCAARARRRRWRRRRGSCSRSFLSHHHRHAPFLFLFLRFRVLRPACRSCCGCRLDRRAWVPASSPLPAARRCCRRRLCWGRRAAPVSPSASGGVSLSRLRPEEAGCRGRVRCRTPPPRCSC